MGTPDRENYQMAPQDDDVENQKAKQVEEEEAGGWTGLSKEELLQVADTPAWNWTRNVLLILFWVTWVAMLIAAIWIVVTVPRCPDVEWWQKNVVYQVEPRSFYDATKEDGIGDLKGIQKKIDYLNDLQVKILYINSIFKQNGTKYPGNHISDFKDVDPDLGTIDDLKDLIETATESSIKVVLEFIPNHSSDQHDWFLESKANETGPKANYYIWSNSPGSETMKDGTTSAWTEVEGRGWYYHSIDPSLPDLNYNDVNLQNEIKKVMKFWLEMGVDGMVVTDIESVADFVGDSASRRRRQVATSEAPAPANTTTASAITAPGATMRAAAVATSARAPAAGSPEPEPETTQNVAMVDGTTEPQPEYILLEDEKFVQDRIEQWREVFTENSYLGKYRLLLTSGSKDISKAVVQYGNKDKLLADFPLNTPFLKEIETLNGEVISEYIKMWKNAKEKVDEETEDRWDSWMMSNNVDYKRAATRFGSELVNAMNTLLLTLHGTPVVMYGEELGMMDNANNSVLAPMSWGTDKNANFSSKTPWQGLDENWKKNNVEVLKKEERSSLELFKSLVSIHLEPPVVAGSFIHISSAGNGIAYLRRLEDWPTYLVVINFDKNEETFKFSSDRVRSEAEAVFSTDGKFSGKLNPQEITLEGYQAAIFKFKPLQ